MFLLRRLCERFVTGEIHFALRICFSVHIAALKKKGVMHPIEFLRIEISIATPVGQIIQLAGG
ncbi:MAG: hypothetical protein RLZZ46_629 [Bacteroidota bacterium]|jgi:hypothetical protein